MNSETDFLFTMADSERERFSYFLGKYMFMAIGTITGIDEETGLASVNVYVDRPKQICEEYNEVEVLLPSGISCSLEGCLCLVMAPRTPITTREGVTLLTTEEAYSTRALKAIPVATFGASQEYGAGARDGGFSLYTPFGDIAVSPSGMGIDYVNSDTKSSISINNEGLVTISNNNTWVKLDKTGNITVTAEDENTITTASLAAGTTQLKRVTNDEDQNTLLDINTNATGEMHIEAAVDSENEKQDIIDINATGITATDVNENSIEMTSDGIVVTDANSNIIEMTSSGIKLSGQSGTMEIE